LQNGARLKSSEKQFRAHSFVFHAQTHINITQDICTIADPLTRTNSTRFEIMIRDHPKRDRRKPRVFKLIEGQPGDDCKQKENDSRQKNTKNTEQLTERSTKRVENTQGKEAANDSVKKISSKHEITGFHESSVQAPPRKRKSKLKKQRNSSVNPATSSSALKSDTRIIPSEQPHRDSKKLTRTSEITTVCVDSDRSSSMKTTAKDAKDTAVEETDGVAAEFEVKKKSKKEKKEKAPSEKKQTEKCRLLATGCNQAKPDDSSHGTKRNQNDTTAKIVGNKSENPKIESKGVSKKKRDTASDSSLAPKQPPKKKRNFQDQVLHQMIIASKPFSMKGLIKSTKSSEAPLNYLMLSLIDKNLVLKKEFGKDAKKVLYWANQDSTSKEALAARATPEEIRVAREDMSQLALQERSLSTVIASLIAQPKNTEIDSKACDIENTINEIRGQMREIETRKEQIFAKLMRGKDGKSVKLIERERCPKRMKMRINAQREEWRKRKSKCMDFTAQMADAMERKLKDVSKTLGIETDEVEGVVLPKKHELKS